MGSSLPAGTPDLLLRLLAAWPSRSSMVKRESSLIFRTVPQLGAVLHDSRIAVELGALFLVVLFASYKWHVIGRRYHQYGN